MSIYSNRRNRASERTSEYRQRRDKAETFSTQRVSHLSNDLLLLCHMRLEESLVVVSGLRHHAMMG